MRIDRHCRWVRHRLPLLIGGELGVEERRRVERHLIGCLDCKEHREASNDALSALRAFAEVGPVGVGVPSLWPALSNQIRQSRHVSPVPSWWETPLPRAWAALGLAMALIGMVAAPLSLLSGREPARPLPPSVELPTVELPKLVSTPSSALPSSRSLPADGPSRSLGNPSFDPTSISSLQFNYDLDHGTPMGPGNRDPQHSY
jgi:Putative zinc-finger